MDTITQGLLGAATAQLGFHQKIGADATWVAAAAGVAPDLDIFIAPLLRTLGVELDDMAGMRIHRGLSHSLLFAPLLSLFLAGLWYWARRRILTHRADKTDENLPPPENAIRTPPAGVKFGWLFACVLLAVATHPLLDWCTSYGTRLFDPITDYRYTIDAAPIVDLIYTTILLLTLLTCFIIRKIRRGSAKRATLLIGWAGFLLSIGYLAAGRCMHDRAIREAIATVQPESIVRTDAYPAVGSIFLWRAVIETPEAWHAVRVHQFANVSPSQRKHRSVAKSPPNEWIERARKQPQYETFNWFANGRLRVEYERINGLHVVRFHDMRYSPQTDGIDSLWTLVVEFDKRGNVQFVGRRMQYRHRRQMSQYAQMAWRDMWTPNDTELPE